MTTISIDLGGTTIKTGIVTDGRVAETAHLPQIRPTVCTQVLPKLNEFAGVGPQNMK